MKCPDCGREMLPYSKNYEPDGQYKFKIIQVDACPKCKLDVVTESSYEINWCGDATIIKRGKERYR